MQLEVQATVRTPLEAEVVVYAHWQTSHETVPARVQRSCCSCSISLILSVQFRINPAIIPRALNRAKEHKHPTARIVSL